MNILSAVLETKVTGRSAPLPKKRCAVFTCVDVGHTWAIKKGGRSWWTPLGACPGAPQTMPGGNMFKHMAPLAWGMWLDMLNIPFSACFTRRSSSRYLVIFSMCSSSNCPCSMTKPSILHCCHIIELLFFVVKNKPRNDCKCLCVYSSAVRHGC